MSFIPKFLDSHLKLHSAVPGWCIYYLITGNAGDSLSSHNGIKFTTKDVDNDKDGSGNCAVFSKGAWWYNYCQYSNLNGLYRISPYYGSDSVNWLSWKNSYYSFKNAEMKIRPRQF